VTVPTHQVAVLTFESGAIGPITMSFDAGGTSGPDLEVYGSEAFLALPDPNWFDGVVRSHPRETDGWTDVPVRGSTGAGRGIGLADMADAIREGRPHRASGELAYHVLDVLMTIEESAIAGRSLEVASTVQRPEPALVA
jgi:predicted dehydrogenase